MQDIPLALRLLMPFDPQEFADWLADAYRRSTFKSYSSLAGAVGVKRATISRYITAGKQGLTGKASQPKAEIVVKLAEVLDADVNAALLAAGYSPRSALRMERPETTQELLRALVELGVLDHIEAFSHDLDDSPESLERLRVSVNAAVTAALTMRYSE